MLLARYTEFPVQWNTNQTWLHGYLNLLVKMCDARRMSPEERGKHRDLPDWWQREQEKKRDEARLKELMAQGMDFNEAMDRVREEKGDPKTIGRFTGAYGRPAMRFGGGRAAAEEPRPQLRGLPAGQPQAGAGRAPRGGRGRLQGDEAQLVQRQRHQALSGLHQGQRAGLAGGRGGRGEGQGDTRQEVGDAKGLTPSGRVC